MLTTRSKGKGGSDRAQLRRNALRKLGVTEHVLAQTPAISHITKNVGDTSKILEYLRGSEVPEARLICELAADLLKTELHLIPIEALCIAAKMPPKKFLGLLIEEVSEQAKVASALLSKAAHPDVVKATIDAAKFTDGVQDRKMLHQAEGFVPVPKTSVTVFRNAQIDARTQTVNQMLPPVEASVRRIGERFLTLPSENAAPVAMLPEPEGPESDEVSE